MFHGSSVAFAFICLYLDKIRFRKREQTKIYETSQQAGFTMPFLMSNKHVSLILVKQISSTVTVTAKYKNKETLLYLNELILGEN